MDKGIEPAVTRPIGIAEAKILGISSLERELKANAFRMAFME